MLIWIGGVVPAYHSLFKAIQNHTELIILSPPQWRHGSKLFKEPLPKGAYTLIQTPFFPSGSSRYLIPLLPFFLLKYRPSHIYLMDEFDRPNTCLHNLIIKLFCPSAYLITYSLQKNKKPNYYRYYHFLSLRINCRLINKVIAASSQAASVVRQHGYKHEIAIIPLGASQDYFYPGEALPLRNKHNIPLNKTIIIYAGSLSEQKGIKQVVECLSQSDNTILITAGTGPLKQTLQKIAGDTIRQFGVADVSLLRELYQLSDYVILPSQSTSDWQEQIGRSLIEGILCGCTALGCNSGFIPEITLFPETLFEEGDKDGLCRMLKNLHELDKTRIFEKQLNKVTKDFLWEHIGEKTFNFIQS
ncbi:MAG: glycosyltransferase [Fibrobacteria bacterium]|nr:glycosyltransferase [Fibrobacteria bacterium]